MPRFPQWLSVCVPCLSDESDDEEREGKGKFGHAKGREGGRVVPECLTTFQFRGKSLSHDPSLSNRAGPTPNHPTNRGRERAGQTLFYREDLDFILGADFWLKMRRDNQTTVNKWQFQTSWVTLCSLQPDDMEGDTWPVGRASFRNSGPNAEERWERGQKSRN